MVACKSGVRHWHAPRCHRAVTVQTLAGHSVPARALRPWLHVRALFDYGFRKARHEFDRAKQPPGVMQAAPTQVVMPAKGNVIQFHETADQTVERLQQFLSKRGESAEAFAETRGATFAQAPDLRGPPRMPPHFLRAK
jgi:hypothetical protein